MKILLAAVLATVIVAPCMAKDDGDKETTSDSKQSQQRMAPVPPPAGIRTEGRTNQVTPTGDAVEKGDHGGNAGGDKGDKDAGDKGAGDKGR